MIDSCVFFCPDRKCERSKDVFCSEDSGFVILLIGYDEERKMLVAGG